MNGIVHQCAHPEEGPQQQNNEEMFPKRRCCVRATVTCPPPRAIHPQLVTVPSVGVASHAAALNKSAAYHLQPPIFCRECLLPAASIATIGGRLAGSRITLHSRRISLNKHVGWGRSWWGISRRGISRRVGGR
jgi:hypothetical protein